ncbi:MAG: hypothetical protein ACFCU3_02315 [Verrucomicrobiales bacterium]
MKRSRRIFAGLAVVWALLFLVAYVLFSMGVFDSEKPEAQPEDATAEATPPPISLPDRDLFISSKTISQPIFTVNEDGEVVNLEPKEVLEILGPYPPVENEE